MKIKDLLQKLQYYNPEMEVVVSVETEDEIERFAINKVYLFKIVVGGTFCLELANPSDATRWKIEVVNKEDKE